jgi:hypothetical protein
MNEIKLEEIDRIVCKIIISNYYNEQALINQIENLQRQLQAQEPAPGPKMAPAN